VVSQSHFIYTTSEGVQPTGIKLISNEGCKNAKFHGVAPSCGEQIHTSHHVHSSDNIMRQRRGFHGLHYGIWVEPPENIIVSQLEKSMVRECIGRTPPGTTSMLLNNRKVVYTQELAIRGSRQGLLGNE
jgi:hypothetical protein